MKLHELHESTEERSVENIMSNVESKYSDTFNCAGYSLTSLKGSPKEVGGTFNCSCNNLTSLQYGPKIVKGDYNCQNNLTLTSLKGASKKCYNFSCYGSKLKSLVGGPVEVNHYTVRHCNLTSLEGAPKLVKRSFNCSENKLTSLEGIHKHFDFIGTQANFVGNPITSHVLGLLLIDGLEEVLLDNQEVQIIVNKHLNGSRDVMECQSDLMDSDLEAFAQL